MIPLLLFFFQVADPALLSQQGAQALRAQRFNEAEAAYRQLVSVDPANPMWRMNLGITLHSAGRYAEAVSEFGQFLKTNPPPGPTHFLLGLSQLKLKKPLRGDWAAGEGVAVEPRSGSTGTCRRPLRVQAL